MLGLFKKKTPEAPKKADSAKKTKSVDNSTPAPKKPVKQEFFGSYHVSILSYINSVSWKDESFDDFRDRVMIVIA